MTPIAPAFESWTVLTARLTEEHDFQITTMAIIKVLPLPLATEVWRAVWGRLADWIRRMQGIAARLGIYRRSDRDIKHRKWGGTTLGNAYPDVHSRSLCLVIIISAPEIQSLFVN